MVTSMYPHKCIFSVLSALYSLCLYSSLIPEPKCYLTSNATIHLPTKQSIWSSTAALNLTVLLNKIEDRLTFFSASIPSLLELLQLPELDLAGSSSAVPCISQVQHQASWFSPQRCHLFYWSGHIRTDKSEIWCKARAQLIITGKDCFIR